MKKIPMIIPTTAEDYSRIPRDLDRFFACLPISRIVFIGPEKLKFLVEADAKKKNREAEVSFLNENDLLPFQEVKKVIKNMLFSKGYEIDENSHPGWYYQQFLKMSFSNICESDHYISWDADTIPLRKIELFDGEKRVFLDVKDEYQREYFETIMNLFRMEKIIKKSFIAEHMVFSAERMREMIGEIESTKYTGDRYYEKIIYAMDLNNIKRGFSEFETYGTWMMHRYPEECSLREWKSMRRGNLFTRCEDLTNEDISWLAQSYDAISFERYHPLIPELAEHFRNKEYRATVSAEELYQIVMQSGLFGEYENGSIREGTHLWPI